MKRVFTIFFLLVEVYFTVVVCGALATKASNKLLLPHWNTVSPALEQKLLGGSSESAESSDDDYDTPAPRKSRFMEKVDHYKMEISNTLEGEAPYYQAAVVASRYWDKLTGKNVTTAVLGTADPFTYDGEDLVIETEDGFFSYPCVYTEEDVAEEIENNISYTVNFASELEKRGINFLFLETGGDCVTNGSRYPMYADLYPDMSIEIADHTLNALKDAGIDCPNVVEVYPEIMREPTKYFFRSDHHWLPQTGLLACRVLSDALNERYGYDIDTDIFDLENYDDSCKAKMLGSTGRAATEAYCEPETITYLLPRYESDLDVYVLDGENFYNGPIEDTLFTYKTFLYQQNPYEQGCYHVYGYGDTALLSVHNNLVHNGKKLLIVKLSMADCMIPYMAGVVEDMDVLDLRHYNGNALDYIDEVQPDTVVMIYGTGSFCENINGFDRLVTEA